MSSEQPYNELGQILASQGEVAVGLSMIKHGSGGGFLLFFEKRFGRLSDESKDALITLADEMVKAGATVNTLPVGSSIPIDQVPLNAFLFGGETEGQRSLFTGEVEIPGSTHRVQLRLSFTDLPTIDELRAKFLERALDIAGNYPGKFGLDPNTPMQGGNVYILLPERAF